MAVWKSVDNASGEGELPAQGFERSHPVRGNRFTIPVPGTGRWEFHRLSWFSQTRRREDPVSTEIARRTPYIPGLSVVDQALSYLMETGLVAHRTDA